MNDPRYYDSPPARGSSVNRWLLVALVVLVAVFVLRTWDVFNFSSVNDPNATARTITPRGDLAADEKSTIELFKQAKPSVVNITTAAYREDSFNPAEISKGTGSGFVWDENGHVVTNFHVIQGADRAQVTLADGTTKDAIFVGGDPDNDLAVLKIRTSGTSLRPIPVGESRDLEVGQHVFAIGNPFGLDHTLTTGVISGLDREIQSVSRRPIRGAIQTDAAINPGNSGGPLLDSAGRLIGVNTAIYSPSGASAGIGFAVPVDRVNRVVPQLIREGKVERPALGIVPRDVTLQGVQGVLVYRVYGETGAEAAGLRGYFTARRQGMMGDLIIAVDGEKTPTTNDLLDVLEKYKAGQTVTVTIVRDGQQTKVQVTLQER